MSPAQTGRRWALVLVLVLGGGASTPARAAAGDAEFRPPTPRRWGPGRGFVRIQGGAAVGYFAGAVRTSAQVQLEYFFIHHFAGRLVADVHLWGGSERRAYHLLWDNLVHLVPHFIVDAYAGPALGLSVLSDGGHRVRAAPLLSAVAGVSVHPWSVLSVGVEARVIWTPDLGARRQWVTAQAAVVLGVFF